MLGLFFEEIDEGLAVGLGGYHFTRDSILAFARKYDPQPFHLSDEGGLAGPFGKLSASGWHTAAGWMKCYVATNSAARARLEAGGKTLPEIGPSPGFANLKWLKPVYPNDTISYRCSVTAKRALTSRPEWGMVFSLNEGFNQMGDLVFSFEGKVLNARQCPSKETSV
jgi:acyl dehydratase